MEALPLFHRVRGETCVLVGAGSVARRKLELLLAAGAALRVVAPECTAEFERLAGEGRLMLVRRRFQAGDLDGAVLAVAATPSPVVNRAVFRAARARGIPVNVVDQPELCTVTFPAVVDRDPVCVAIGTGGASPVLARLLRTRLEALLPGRTGELAALAREFRAPVRERIADATARRAFWEAVLQGSVAELIYSGRPQAARRQLERQLDAAAPAQSRIGEVYLVGAGPGDPDLLTFRALRLMQQADVVLYDRLVAEPILALVRRDAERVYVGKRAGVHAVPQQDINARLVEYARAGKRVLRLKFRLGLFENSQTDESLPGQTWLKPEHRQLARKVAAESLVLLQNRGNLLPLSKKVKKVALIGPLGDAPDDQLGTWRGEGQAKDTVTLLAGLRQELPQSRVEYLKGCSAHGKGKPQIEAAVKLARQSDVVILALGESADMSGEANSRSRLDLPGQQLQLLQAVKATGKPCVVVLMNGRPLCLDWVWKNCPAVLEAWHPGSEGGPAIADVLFGDVNPSGKLTMSFPRSEGQIPVFYNHRNTGRPYNPADKYTSHYRDLPNSPQFAFGHGLSYTRFELSNLQVSPSKGALGREFQAQVELTNTGPRAGAEVVQLYVRDKVASISRPVRELKGFQKVELAPGESRTVRFRLGTRELGMFDGQMNFRVEPGEFEVIVGQSSEGGLSQVVEVVP